MSLSGSTFPVEFERVGKRPHVKADLAIHSHILGVSGYCLSVAVILSYKFDFSHFVPIRSVFANSLTLPVCICTICKFTVHDIQIMHNYISYGFTCL